MDKSQVMMKFVNERKYSSYLEIGIFHGRNFSMMNAPFSMKIGVDPNQSSPATFHMTSDEFFEKFGSSMKFDLVFIDGMHLSEYVHRDIQNSLKALNPGGMIVCHDMLPPTKERQTRDMGWYERGMGFDWNGDCWKAFAYTIPRCQFYCYTLDTDEGLGIIDTSLGRNPEEQDTGYMKEISEMTWEDLNSDRNRIMNVKGLQFVGLS
jgi:hypothetical protein